MFLEHRKIMLLFSEKMTSGKHDLGKLAERPVSCPQGPLTFPKMKSGKNDLRQKPQTTSVMPAGALKFPTNNILQK